MRRTRRRQPPGFGAEPGKLGLNSPGPDGALYFADWHNPIIGHMQHHLRDPNRDKAHGRIYRITYEGRPLLKQPKIHGASVPELLNLLKEPENQVRELAKIEGLEGWARLLE